MHLPKHISLEANRPESKFRILVDGEEFPYAVADAPLVAVDTDGCPSVTLRLLAERVTVDHSL